MIGLIIFNVATMAVAAGVASRLVPTSFYAGFIGYLHNIIGITTPTEQKVRMVALIWIVSMTVIVDGLLFLLVLIAYLTR